MTERAPSFPRGTSLPAQTPLYWVADKDRYLRQLLLRDMEARTGRRQIVYFTRTDGPGQIDQDDDRLMVELLSDCPVGPLDLILETNGGYTDSAEKLVSLLEPYRADLRVIIPRRAKSNGTLIALAARAIVMGIGSELGPIDPSIPLAPGRSVPAQFVIQAQDADPIIRQIAQYAIIQTRTLAHRLLASGQFTGRCSTDVEAVVNALSDRNSYPSHGSVIDHREAAALGLSVEFWSPDSENWKWVWLLRCMYEIDARRASLTKIFEGRAISNSIRGA